MKAKLPQGVGKGPGNMQSMLRQAQKMQEDVAQKQAELEAVVCQEQPDFVQMEALSTELNQLKEQVQNAPLAKVMQTARQNFNAMMQQVNAELQMVLAPEGASSCSGNCSSCGSSCSSKH